MIALLLIHFWIYQNPDAHVYLFHLNEGWQLNSPLSHMTMSDKDILIHF